MKFEDLKTAQIREILNVSTVYASDLRRRVKKVPIPHCLTLHKEFGIKLNDMRPDVYPQ